MTHFPRTTLTMRGAIVEDGRLSIRAHSESVWNRSSIDVLLMELWEALVLLLWICTVNLYLWTWSIMAWSSLPRFKSLRKRMTWLSVIASACAKATFFSVFSTRLRWICLHLNPPHTYDKIASVFSLPYHLGFSRKKSAERSDGSIQMGQVLKQRRCKSIIEKPAR